ERGLGALPVVKVLPEDRRPAEDRGERRAQLVGERREELVLRARRALRLLARRPLLLERPLALLPDPRALEEVGRLTPEGVEEAQVGVGGPVRHAPVRREDADDRAVAREERRALDGADPALAEGRPDLLRERQLGRPEVLDDDAGPALERQAPGGAGTGTDSGPESLGA